MLFSDLPTFDPVDDVYGGAAEGMADASDFPVDDEEIPDTGMSLRNPMVNSLVFMLFDYFCALQSVPSVGKFRFGCSTILP